MNSGMSDCCDHPPWDHVTVTFPRHHRPCNSLTCCDRPKKSHDGPGHQPTYCMCDDWRPPQP